MLLAFMRRAAAEALFPLTIQRLMILTLFREVSAILRSLDAYLMHTRDYAFIAAISLIYAFLAKFDVESTAAILSFKRFRLRHFLD